MKAFTVIVLNSNVFMIHHNIAVIIIFHITRRKDKEEGMTYMGSIGR